MADKVGQRLRELEREVGRDLRSHSFCRCSARLGCRRGRDDFEHARRRADVDPSGHGNCRCALGPAPREIQMSKGVQSVDTGDRTPGLTLAAVRFVDASQGWVVGHYRHQARSLILHKREGRGFEDGQATSTARIGRRWQCPARHTCGPSVPERRRSSRSICTEVQLPAAGRTEATSESPHSLQALVATQRTRR